jgi:hypothetical protein
MPIINIPYDNRCRYRGAYYCTQYRCAYYYTRHRHAYYYALLYILVVALSIVLYRRVSLYIVEYRRISSSIVVYHRAHRCIRSRY